MDGHLDHEILSTASCETLEDDAMLTHSQLHKCIPEYKESCSNCHSFLEKMFLSAHPERMSYMNGELYVENFVLYHFGHGDEKCTFMDLKQSCNYCGTPVFISCWLDFTLFRATYCFLSVR